MSADQIPAQRERQSGELREVRMTHHHGFRSGQWARVLTTVEARGRPCWLVQFPDGKLDEWVIEDPSAGYEVRG